MGLVSQQMARTILILLVLTLSYSCQKSKTITVINLWEELPFSEAPTAANAPYPFFYKITGPRGPSKLPDPALAKPSFIYKIRQEASSRITFALRVGEKPYIKFVPLVEKEQCNVWFYIHVNRELVAKVPSTPILLPSPEEVYIPLKEENEEIELTLGVEAPAGDYCVGIWGSPIVVYRNSSVQNHQKKNKERLNVLLIGIDTLRWDVLGIGGMYPSPSPFIDNLAKNSILFTKAYTVFNVTTPSFSSILTGRYGKSHGVYGLTDKLSEDIPFLPEILYKNGYKTFAFFSVAHLTHEYSGLGRGFIYTYGARGPAAAEAAVEKFFSWYKRYNIATENFFAFLHIFDPHTPHTPPRPFSNGITVTTLNALKPTKWHPFRTLKPLTIEDTELFASRDLYLSEVAYVDFQIGRVINFLKENDLLDNTVIILVSDHGENLGEHGIKFRHTGLFETTTHVPLILKIPGVVPRVTNSLVSTIDIFPTLLKLLKIPPIKNDGEDLLSSIKNRSSRKHVFFEASSHLGEGVRTNRFHYFRYKGNPFLTKGKYLFDIKKDPKGIQNIYNPNDPKIKEIVEKLDLLLDNFIKNKKITKREIPLDNKIKKELEALGYK